MSSFAILLYHGVTKNVPRGIENCSGKHLPEEAFDRQMARLAKEYHVMRLEEILTQRQQGVLPPRTVAVTFDDGFENNFSVALPILKRYGIAATFFLSTGLIGGDDVFWVDKLEYHLNESPRVVLPLKTVGRDYALNSGQERREALIDIKRTLKSRPGLVERTVEELEQKSGVLARYDYADYQTLTWDQVTQMDRSGLCDFGAHTQTHAILSHLSRSEKESQIRASKITLEERLDRPIHLFAYPEGLRHHYDAQTIEILKSYGFTSASTALFGLNTDSTPDHQLYRNMVGMTAPFKSCLEVLDEACC